MRLQVREQPQLGGVKGGAPVGARRDRPSPARLNSFTWSISTPNAAAAGQDVVDLAKKMARGRWVGQGQVDLGQLKPEGTASHGST